jgi:hypothetical protein
MHTLSIQSYGLPVQMLAKGDWYCIRVGALQFDGKCEGIEHGKRLCVAKLRDLLKPIGDFLRKEKTCKDTR